MPRVFNKKRKFPAGAVYIGRPSKWGNPYVIGKDGTRVEVVAKYERWIRDYRRDLLDAAKVELRGKDLVCWCAPEACHGDVLLKIANEPGEIEKVEK